MKECDEQIALSEALTLMRIPHFSLRNEESIKSMAYLNKRKLMGWQPGVSDMMVYIPPDRSYVARGLLVFIELKKARKKLSRASVRGDRGDMVTQNEPTVDQLDFIEKINTVKDCQGFVANGCSEALDIINKFLTT